MQDEAPKVSIEIQADQEAKQNAIELAKKIKEHLATNELDIMKLEDILLFYHPLRAAILLIVVNVIFICIHFSPLSGYSIFFFGSVILAALRTFGKALVPIKKFILPQEMIEIPEDATRQRFTIQQISASIAIAYFVILKGIKMVKKGIDTKHIATIFISYFMLLILFYLFLSFGDTFIICSLANVLLLLPILIRFKFAETIKNFTSKFSKKQTEEEKPKIE